MPSVVEVGRGEDSVGRRSIGSLPFSNLSRIRSVCTDKSRSKSGVGSEGKVGGGDGESRAHVGGGETVESPTRCVGQSFRSVMVTVLLIPSRTVVVGPVRFRTVQSGHQEGGIGRAVEFVGIGVSVSAGSIEMQDIEACLSPQ